MRRQPEDTQCAFTLVELLVAVAIAGILAGTGLVNLSQRWSQERLLLASRQLNSWLDEQRATPCNILEPARSRSTRQLQV